MDNDVPCQCRVVICNKCTALVGAVDSREDWTCWWGRGVSVDCMWDLFELFSILLWVYNFLQIKPIFFFLSFSSIAQSCLTLCDPMNHSMPGLPVHHQLLGSTQTHVQWVGDAIQPSHPLSSPSPPAFNPSQHQTLFKWVSYSHQVVKVLEFQLQHQSFQLRTDFL